MIGGLTSGQSHPCISLATRNVYKFITAAKTFNDALLKFVGEVARLKAKYFVSQWTDVSDYSNQSDLTPIVR